MKNLELTDKKYNINEIMTNNIDSEKDEIRSIRKEKKNKEKAIKKKFQMKKKMKAKMLL